MNANLRKLHDTGQRVWLDHITRELLTSGRLASYISAFSVTGLTSNPTLFERAIASGEAYDDAIRDGASRGLSVEEIFFELAIQDLTQAADLFRPIFDASDGVDGWVSLEVSPLLANDSVNTNNAAARLHAEAACPNLFVKIPGTLEGIASIEQSIFDGIPINVTLLFSRDQYVAAAEAYMRGIERRLTAGLDPRVHSVASLFVSRWDVAVRDDVLPQFQNRLGIAMAMHTYVAYRELLSSPRWQRLAAAGARPQRLLWASTGVKDKTLADTLYVKALTAPDTSNTIPEKTLLEFADHGEVGEALPVDGGFSEAVLEEFRREGIDVEALAAKLQRDGVAAFVTSWGALLSGIAEKRAHRSLNTTQALL
ncbi:MAG: transaldolase [Aeromicrobium sp.]|nr:transaldolase [Burkholderiales bacterium]